MQTTPIFQLYQMFLRPCLGPRIRHPCLPALTVAACLPVSCLRSGEGEIHRLGSCPVRDLVEKTRFDIRNLKTGKIGGLRGLLRQPDDLIGPTGDNLGGYL